MRNWFKRPTFIVIVVLIVICAQFSFFNPVRDIVRKTIGLPVSVFDHIYLSIRNDFHVITRAGSLSSENAKLNDQMLNLQAEVSSLQAVKIENDQLRKDLGFSQAHPELKLIPANVVDISSSTSSSIITIAKGSKDGLATGQAVVSSGYLVGKLGAVSNSTSEVKLLINRDVQIPVIFNTSQATGILSGGVEGLVVGDVPINTNIITGETVATTNLENIYPPGIPIGQVENVISQKQDIFLSVRIASPINVGTLSQVFVAQIK